MENSEVEDEEAIVSDIVNCQVPNQIIEKA